jgi:2,4-dienoyl-CoA reductase-like NADH-dependent reductase (Old Yellow Enzyme family)
VYRVLISELGKLNLAYLHILHRGDEEFLKETRLAWPKALLVNRAGRPLEQLAVDIDADLADMAPVGAWALANPDLVERLKIGASLNPADPPTFFGGDAHGYIDYPTLADNSIQNR